ncbi:MAG: carboxypeptidase regulatory-like domain-containing protein [Acidobacteriia bacterium]|nr:carboxypeptidase regulatory-like domain-containing protein [Terriglobia bacterium]
MLKGRFRIALVLTFLTLSWASAGWAQYNAGFQGVVSDSTGAVVPGVKVVATNTSSGVSYGATSNDAGVFHITNIPPGTYTLNAEKQGFQKAEVANAILHTEELKGVNLTLQVGTLTQTVNVTVAAPLLNTEQAHLAEDISNVSLENLPIEGENPLTALQLLPGITGITPGNSDVFSVADTAAVNANGLRSSSNNYQIDGTTVTETPNGGTMNIAPSLDDLAELHVTTNNFSAEHGRSAGFQLDATTKSGTNEFHGDAYYEGITARANANSFFSNTSPAAPGGNAYKPRFDKNLFGGSIGGPIKKNKAFFFGSYSGLRQRGGPSATTGNPGVVTTVETQDFANYVAATYPNNLSTILLKKYPPVNYASANFVTAGQYSDGFFAKASQFPADLPVVGTTVYAVPLYDDGEHYLGRFDYNFSDRDRFYTSFMQTRVSSQQPNTRPAFTYLYPEGDSFFKINETHIFSPTMLNEFSGGFSRTGSAVPGANPSVPSISLNDGAAGFGIFSSIPFGFFQMNYEWKDILTKYQGKHNLKMGFNLMRGHDDFFSVSKPSYTFQNILDFAIDQPLSENLQVDPKTGIAKGSNYEERTWEAAAFIQDDYKITPRLTLNLGLRWEDYFHPTENFGTFANFAFGSGSTLAERIANGSMQLSANPYKNSNFNLAPRFGYSWNPKTKLVLRGGFGVTYDRIPNGDWESLATNPPVLASANAGPIFNTPIVYGIGGSGPNFGFPPNPAFATGLDPHNGILGARVGVVAVDPNFTIPYILNWIQGVQYQLTTNWMFEIDYLGSAAHHLAWINNINRFPGDLLTNGTFHGYSQSFANISYLQSQASSAYNALSLQAQHRMSHNVSLNAVYTWSRAIDDTSVDGNDPVDIQNRKLERGLSNFDHAQKFTAYATWNLPGLQGSNRFLKTVAGGWKVTPLVMLQSGAPFNVLCGSSFNFANPSQGCDWNADGTSTDRPNAPAFGLKIANPNNSKFINGVFPASAFSAPALGTDGSLGRNVYIGPGYASTDFSIRKVLDVYRERFKLQVRADAFNLFNRVNLSGVDGNLSDAGTTFGKAVGTYNPRELQLGLKLMF